MSNEDSHISDQELLESIDGEAPRRRGLQIQAHLEACWTCRTRSREIEQTIADYVHASKNRVSAGIPPIDGPRALLRARLNQLAAASQPSSWGRVRQFVFENSVAAYGSLAFGVALMVGLVAYFSVVNVGAASTPDSNLTPGVTRSVTRDDICTVQPATGFYPIPATLAYRVFEKYRIRNPRPRSYEVDYLITPALGGADDIRNLWPQPYASGEWNAHVKDALEDHLQDLVCEGKLDLETAQHDIAANWISAYQKYFKTNRPLDNHAGFSIDPPWED